MFWLLYFCFVLEYVKITIIIFSIIGILCFTTLFIMSLFKSSFEDKVEESFIKYDKLIRKVLIICIIFLLLGSFLPMQKDMLIIVTIDKLSKTDQLKQANEITKKALKLLENKLDFYLEENKSLFRRKEK